MMEDDSMCTNIGNIDGVKINNTNGKYTFFIWEFETAILWNNVIFMASWHIIAAYGVLTHNYIQSPGIVLYCIMLYGIAGFGGTAGAHRYWTHRSFKAKLPLKIILLICYSITGMNSIKDWVRDHRIHHKYCETDADPHNTKRGLFFAHMGWLMMRKHPDVIEKGKKEDLSDLFADPLVAFHQRHFPLIKFIFCFVLTTIIPPFLYGETWYNSILWVCFVRYVISLHAVWAVNSFAHMWGTKPYNKDIFPVENLAVSFFAMGEGYHNYHHTFPYDYRTAELGRMLNATTLFLNLFEKIGWAYDMRMPSREMVERVVKLKGDGTHEKWSREMPNEQSDDLAGLIKKSL